MKFVCVYCGASEQADAIYRNSALELGKLVGQAGFGLVYGGGRLGLMGLVADATIDHGGIAVGYTTEHLDDREGAHPGLSELHIVDTMHTRKMKMAEKADFFAILPGGFGTLDEFFEMMTWKQIGLHNKPIAIVNINNYWDPLKHLMESVIDAKFARTEHRQLIEFVSTPEEAIAFAKRQLLCEKHVQQGCCPSHGHQNSAHG